MTLNRAPGYCTEIPLSSFELYWPKSADSDHQESKGNDESDGSQPMVEVPAALLGLPVGGERVGCPGLDPIVDRDRSDEGEDDGKNLNRGRDGGQRPCRAGQMRKGKDEHQVQQG